MKIRISEIAKERGFKNAYELASRSGLNYPTADRAFRNDIKQFTPDTLERLCKTLFCTPNDIFGIDAAVPYPSLSGERSADEISPEQYKRLSKAAQKEHEKNRNTFLGRQRREQAKQKEAAKTDDQTAAGKKAKGKSIAGFEVGSDSWNSFTEAEQKQLYEQQRYLEETFEERQAAYKKYEDEHAGKTYYNKSGLKQRGWTDAMIRDLADGIGYRQGLTCAAGTAGFNYKYYYEDKKVYAIEKTKAFKERIKAKRNRKSRD